MAARDEDWSAVLDRLLQGDHAAFLELSRLITGFLAGMRAYDFRDEWDDVVQAVILAAVLAKRSNKLREPTAIVAYLRSTTRFKFVDFLRSKRRQADPLEPELEKRTELAWPVEASSEEKLDLRAHLAKLPEKQRKAVQAVYWEGRTYPEAAEATGIPLGSLKRYLRDGLAALRQQLGPDWKVIR